MARLPSRPLAAAGNPAYRISQQFRGGFYGWRMLLLLFGPRSVGAAAIGIGTTLFVLPLEQGLDISRGTSSLLFAVGGFLYNASAPLSGTLIDRRGPRQVLLGSILIMAAGFVLFSQAWNVAMVFVAWLALISLSAPNVAWNASSSMVNNWFQRHKARAMALIGIGSSLGGVIIVPLLAFSIGQWDWRVAALIMAALALLLGLPAVIFTRDHPEEMGLNPDGDQGPAASPASQDGETAGTEASPETSMKEALRLRAFWTVTGAVVCFAAAVAAINIHMVPVLVSKGMPETTAGFALSLRAFVSIPVMLSAGWIGDRFGRLAVTTAMVAFLGLGSLALAGSQASWHLWASVVLLSGSQGLYPLTWAAVGGLFGRKSYATIRGYIMAAAAVGATALPALVGFLFEWEASYTVALLIIGGFCAASAAFMTLTPRRAR